MTVPDVVVLGGGAAGLAAARAAARQRLSVILIERADRLGGERLRHGCVPANALIHAARLAALVGRAGEFGIDGGRGRADLATVMARCRGVAAELRRRDDEDSLRRDGVQVLFGEARFLSPYEVEVKGQRLRARRFVIATGSRPALPALDGLERSPALTTDDLFDLTQAPERLVVMGGGPAGVELGQALARLGSRVTLLEPLPEILAREDPQLAAELRGLLVAQGMDVQVGTQVERLEPGSGPMRLICRRGEEFLPVEADALLLAVGRRPNVESLELEAAGVEYDRLGVKVDSRMRTSRRHIYACGDCTGLYPSSAAAEQQAAVVVRNVAGWGWPARLSDAAALPWVTRSDPELARVGMTGQQALDAGLDAEVLDVPFNEVDRAVVMGETAGRARLVVSRGRILGASILGPAAGELIHELVLAMNAGLSLQRLGQVAQPYPALGQVYRSAAAQAVARRSRTGPAQWLRRVVRGGKDGGLRTED